MSKYESSDNRIWKTISELDEQANEQLSNRQEFVDGYDQPPVFETPIGRRSFMAMLSAGMAITAAACRRPDHKLVPAIKGTEYITPGLPNYYTSVYMHKNSAQPVLVKVREGRPVKIDGNDRHAVSAGKSGVFTQATLLDLYDPERIRQSITGRVPGNAKSGGYSTPQNAVSMIAKAITASATSGKETAILLDEHCSPSLASLCADISAQNPQVKFYTMPSFLAENGAIANNALFGIDAEFVPDLSKADVIVSVDSDFLGTDKNAVYHIRNFASKRKPTKADMTMNQLVVVESAYSLTGSNADTRIKVAPSQYDGFMLALYNAVAGKKGMSAMPGNALMQDKANALANKLVSAGNKGCVLVGGHLSPMANGLGMAINSMIGSVGAGEIFSAILPMSNRKGEAIANLRNDVRSGKVEVVLFCGVNPELTADRDLKRLLTSVPQRFSYTYLDDETALNTSINIPATHQFESWGDAVTFDGTLTIQQPLVAPLNEGSLSLGDMLLSLAKALNSSSFAEVATYYDFVKARWMTVVGDEAGWEKALRDGAVSQTSAPSSITMNSSGLSSLASAPKLGDVTVLVHPSYAVYDGTFSNNCWMLECPDPITKHTWENVAQMSKATAEKLGVKDNDVILVSVGNEGIELPVMVQPGMVDGVIATTLGFGRTTGKIGAGYGTNAYQLTSNSAIGYYNASVSKTEKRNVVARTQTAFHTQHNAKWKPEEQEEKNRNIVYDMTLADFKSGKEVTGTRFDGEEDEKSRFKIPLNIVSGYEYKGHKWGMVIDMSSCTGCNACVIACQSENNVPAVGKEQVIRGREMHWIRLDRYYKGTPEEPISMVEPMICQHCENAPCENVCPVAATTHSPEGLNEMTYNRCVGTRYCLNNCPYKVRRFNFLDYRENMYKDKLGNANPTPLDMVFNPDVTVRMRGVMEKCTFCVQRINEAKYHAKDKGESRVADGDVVTACQQACPASAIYFGNTNDQNSKVSKMREEKRSFLVLEELNVRPSVTYLARVRNVDADKA